MNIPARTLRITLLLAALPLLLAACAARSEPPAGFGANTISGEQLRRFATVQEAVQALRPAWLRQRTPLYLDRSTESGTTPANPVWVYRDGTRLGSVELLRNTSTADVALVEYYDARAAQLRWGINHENGVIHLVSPQTIE